MGVGGRVAGEFEVYAEAGLTWDGVGGEGQQLIVGVGRQRVEDGAC